ncbi:hypothetical protein C4568_03870 [Candidatus Parcubacteria bacterium]|nr:MAG: hypothetical protein C4568_03870 [Candidatus Parcubacteria bacterium]
MPLFCEEKNFDAQKSGARWPLPKGDAMSAFCYHAIMRRIAAIALIVLFILFAVFGLYMPTAAHHHAMCPFAAGIVLLCSTPLAHLSHWKAVFVMVLTEVLLLAALIILVFSSGIVHLPLDDKYKRYRLLRRIPVRPTLWQELFSQGILNRKEPSMACHSY